MPDEAAPLSGATPPSLEPAPRRLRRNQASNGYLTNAIVVIGLLAVSGLLAVLTMAGRDSSGSIDRAGDLAVTSLKVGDCFDLPVEAGAIVPIQKADAKPCDEPHHYEVFFVGLVPDQSADADIGAWAHANCDPAFGAYVGSPVDRSSATYKVFYQVSWTAGNRGAQCSLADSARRVLNQSLKGSRY